MSSTIVPRPSRPIFRSGSIRVRNLQLLSSIMPDAWGRSGKAQPTVVSLTLHRPDHLRKASVQDSYEHTKSYSELAQLARKLHEEPPVAEGIDQTTKPLSSLAAAHELFCRTFFPGARAIEIETIFPQGLVRGTGGWGLRSSVVDVDGDGNGGAGGGNDAGGGAERDERSRTPLVLHSCILIKDLRLACVIGINPHERLRRQDVIVNLEAVVKVPKTSQPVTEQGAQPVTEQGVQPMTGQGAQLVTGQGDHGVNDDERTKLQNAVDVVIERVEQSTFQTVEALALEVANVFGKTGAWSRTTVRVEKPYAIADVDGCGVELVLDWEHRQKSA